MKTSNPPLPLGYSPVPPRKLANLVTCLEMRAKPERVPAAGPEGLTVTRMDPVDLAAYRSLYRQVGADWLWVSRLAMPDEALHAAIAHPAVEIHILLDGDRPAGLLELDFREEGDCEIVYFGLTKDTIGRGAGRYLMEQGLAIAWAHPIRRVWLHTCNFDHPAALAFYRRCGFTPYAFMVEVVDDPRLTGDLPRSAVPQIPLLG